MTAITKIQNQQNSHTLLNNGIKILVATMKIKAKRSFLEKIRIQDSTKQARI